jgi:hypothetical protein
MLILAGGDPPVDLGNVRFKLLASNRLAPSVTIAPN